MIDCKRFILTWLATITLSIGTVQAQVQIDNLYQLIGQIVADQELNTVLYSYNHNGDYPLFLAYNDAIKEAIDTTKYSMLDSWKYQINMDFQGNRVYLRNYAFLLAHLVQFYIQFDTIEIDGNAACIKLRSNTMDTQLDNLYYFVGEIRFERQGGIWKIVDKILEEKKIK